MDAATIPSTFAWSGEKRIERSARKGFMARSEERHVLLDEHLGERALRVHEPSGERFQERLVDVARALGGSEPEDVGVQLDHGEVREGGHRGEAPRGAAPEERG